MMDEQDKGLEKKLGMGTDIDIAKSVFGDYFPIQKEIMFSFRYAESALNFLLKADKMLSMLKKEGWVCARNAYVVRAEVYSGFVYLRKDNIELGTAGFVEQKGEEIIVQGILYTPNQSDSEHIYQKIIGNLGRKLCIDLKLE